MFKTVRNSLLVLLAAMPLLAVAAPPLTAGEVYSWKDARGVTHYSQTPPPAGTRFEVRGIRNDAPATPAPAAAPAAQGAIPDAVSQSAPACHRLVGKAAAIRSIPAPER